MVSVRAYFLLFSVFAATSQARSSELWNQARSAEPSPHCEGALSSTCKSLLQTSSKAAKGGPFELLDAEDAVRGGHVKRLEFSMAGRRRRRKGSRRRRAFNIKKRIKQLKRTSSKLAKRVDKTTVQAAEYAYQQVKAALPLGQLQSLGNSASKTATVLNQRISKVGNAAASQVSSVQKLGALIVDTTRSVASAVDSAVDAFTSMLQLDCFDFNKIMCLATLSSFDCNAGSGLALSFDDLPTATIAVVPGPFAKHLYARTTAGGWTSGSGSVKGGIEGRSDTAVDLASMMYQVPGVPLSVGFNAEAEFTPNMTIDIVPGQPKVKIHFSGLVYAGVDALVQATGAVSWTKTVKFPETPLTATACASMFCMVFVLQAQAQLDVTTSNSTGNLGVQAQAEFSTGVTVELDLSSGKFEYDVNDGDMTHEETLDMGITFVGSAKLSLSPILTVMPFPGAPISIKPLVALEAKTISQELSEDTDDWTDPVTGAVSDQCASASLNLHTTTHVEALGLPEEISFSMAQIKDEIIDGMLKMPINVVNAIEETLSSCLPVGPALSAIIAPMKAAAEDAAGAIKDAIPNFNLSLSIPTTTVFEISSCETVVSASLPEGSTCGATNLGC